MTSASQWYFLGKDAIPCPLAMLLESEQVATHPHSSDFIFLILLHSTCISRVSERRDQQKFYAEMQMANMAPLPHAHWAYSGNS